MNITEINKMEAKDKKSGVILKDYYKLQFSEHVWTHNDTLESNKMHGEHIMQEWKFTADELVSMVNVVVKVDEYDSYLVKNKYGKDRESYGCKTSVYEKLFNDYQNELYASIDGKDLYKLDADKIKLLVYGKKHRVVKDVEIKEPAGTIPSVYTIVDYPMHPEFMCADNGKFVLNIGSEYETAVSKQDAVKAGHFLRMVYINLCDYPVMRNAAGDCLSIIEECEVLYEKVLFNTYSADERDFKFVINWLAALVQNPGINLMTNVWFAGAYQGIGKGTLVNYMKFIMGESRAALLKPNMITGSFNGPLDGKFILEINEKQQGITPLMMTNWLKSFSQEDTMQIEKKGHDPFTRKNMINVIGTAQTPEDVFKIEDEDRRNVIFQTVSQDGDYELVHRKYAKFVAEGLKNEKGWGEALAWVLERVEVDMALIGTAYKTRSYDEIKTTQTASKNKLYYWAQTQFIGYAKLGKFRLSDMRDDYLLKNRDSISATYFNKLIKELNGVQGIPAFIIKNPGNVLTADFNFIKPVVISSAAKTLAALGEVK